MDAEKVPSLMQWNRAWTGGQYSAVRVIVGMVLASVLLRHAFDTTGFHMLPGILAAGCVLVMLGTRGSRLLALAIVVAVPLTAHAAERVDALAMPMLWLLMYVATPPAPYGSLAARGREDARGSWRMPAWYPAVWYVLFVVSCFGSALTSFQAGNRFAAIAFLVPGMLALAPRSALFAWALSLGLDLGMAASGSQTFAFAFLFHLLTFQPAWAVRGDRSTGATVFYDGTCALCHGAVRFLLAEDRPPHRFRIAPLDGPTFLAEVPEPARATRPDSVIVVRDGPAGTRVLWKSAAAVEILSELGGLWWLAALPLRLVPRGLLDALYDAVASRRYRWFGRKSEACPMMDASDRVRLQA